MSCAENAEYMQRDLDGDLTDDERLSMRNHLQVCDDCRIEYACLKQLSFELEHLPKVDPPFSLVDQILPQLERERDVQPKHQFHWKRWSIIAGGLAALAVVAILSQRMLPSNLEPYGATTENATEDQLRSFAFTEESDQTFVEERALNDDQTLAANNGPSAAPNRENIEPTAKQPLKSNELPSANGADAQQARTEPERSSEPTEETPLPPEEEFLTAAQQPESEPSITAMEDRQREELDVSASNSGVREEIMMSRIMVAPAEAENDRSFSVESPNGNWTAQVERNQLIVLDREGNEAFRAHQWDDPVDVSVEWVDDTRLVYRLQSPDLSKAETWLVDLEEKQELKQ